MPRSEGSDVDDALPLGAAVEPETPAPAPPDTEPDADGPLVGLSAVTLPDPVVGLSAVMLPDPLVGLSAVMLPDPVVGLSAVTLPDPLAPPDVDEPTLGVAVAELLPGIVEGVVPGEALGLLTLAWASRLHRSKSAWLGDDDWANARVPAASRVPAEIKAATCLTVIMWSSSNGFWERRALPCGHQNRLQAKCQRNGVECPQSAAETRG
jgi:hypothetical protein